MIHFGIRTRFKRIMDKYNQNRPAYYYRWLYYAPKKYAHQKLYEIIMKKKLDYQNAVDFNEKQHYLMVYHYGKKEAFLSDKIKVKDYVLKKHIRGLHVPKTYQIYKNANDIRLDELPNSFVLKCNHASGDVIICDNKKNFHLDSYIDLLNNKVKTNYAKAALEYHYRYIKPYIMAEEYLNDHNGSKNPIDYKVYCSRGKALSFLVCSERESGLKLSEYDLNWKKIDCITKEFQSKVEIPKPKKLKEIIRIAEELSKDLNFVRVDLYEINDKIYFGEYTFTPAAGICNYYTPYGLKLHGDYINLDLYKEKD